MIQLTGINIEFNRPIIQAGAITIPDASITALVGESGSGKTSLLYLLGLISSNRGYRYSFDGIEVNLDSDAEVSALRKTKIGYVFQDNTLVDSISIRENIRLAARIAGRTISDDDIERHLKFVELDIDSQVYPRVLSGGEQQRVAIACALAKDPDLIIADEPTSALDRQNADLILGIFRKVAREMRKKVVLATHNEAIAREADQVYTIKGCRIIDETRSADSASPAADNPADYEHTSSAGVDRRRLGFRFFMSYARQAGRKARIQRTLMLTLCAVAVAFTLMVNSLGEGFVEKQEALMNSISDREILVVNLTMPSDLILDYDENLSMSEDQLTRLAGLDNLEAVYPYYEFRSTGFRADNGESYTSAEVTVLRGDEPAEEDRRDVIRFENGDRENSTLIIAPCYPGQKLEKRLSAAAPDPENGDVYLSHDLAESLSLDKLDSVVSLEVAIGVPVATTPVELTVNSGRSAADQSSGYAADIDCSLIRTLHLRVAGILNPDVTNTYSGSGNQVIYMPFAAMDQFRRQTQSEYAGQIGGAGSGIETRLWQPSACVLFAASYNDIGTLLRKVGAIDENFSGKSRYQDIESMNQMMSDIQSTIFIISIVVLAVLILLTAIIFANHVHGRKFEMAVLKANGLTRLEMIWLVLTESLRHISVVFLISLAVAILLGRLANLLFSAEVVNFSWLTATTLLLVSALTIAMPTLVSTWVINRVKPDQVFRN